MKSKLSWLKEKVDSAQSTISSNFSTVVATTGSLLSQVNLLQWSEELTKSAATVYDKALDLEYLKTHIGGGDHRLFDGGHDIFNAWDRAKDASSNDSFSEEVIGYISSLWKDVTTTKGLPFQTMDKAAFDTLPTRFRPGIFPAWIANTLWIYCLSMRLKSCLQDLPQLRSSSRLRRMIRKSWLRFSVLSV